MAERVVLLSCEHGGNHIPAAHASLFVQQEALLASHRGWDPGALAVAEHLSRHLARPLYATTVSRLLIDSNRSLHHPRLWSPMSRALPQAERAAVLQHHYHGHRQAIAAEVARLAGQGRQVVHLAIHSFTPILDGHPRRAELGLLYDPRRRGEADLCRLWREGLRGLRPGWTVRRNYPYLGRSDSLAAALRRQWGENSYLGIEVELNQARLGRPEQCAAMAELLAHGLRPMLGAVAPPASHNPGEEMVRIVDRDNRPLGTRCRREMRRQNLIHQASYVLVFNRRDELFVQRRTQTKDIYPGYYDIAAGGVVVAGESFEESAQRELREELGVSAELETLGDRYFEDSRNRVWGRIFRCRHQGPFVLQATEVESGEFMAVADILAATDRRFTPDGLAILAELSEGNRLQGPPSAESGGLRCGKVRP